MSMDLTAASAKISNLRKQLRAAQAEADKIADKKALLIGRAVMAEAKKNAEFEKTVADVVNRRVKKLRARQLLGLSDKAPSGASLPDDGSPAPVRHGFSGQNSSGSGG